MTDKKMLALRQLAKDFINPGKDYRGAPFWSWNGRLSVPELKRQVRDMKAHGMGGFFMHAREGLETPYLSDEWMKCIRETVAEAKKSGLNAWLYDEDRWPSGAAGGIVPSRGGDECRAKGLVMKIIEKGIVKTTGKESAVFRIRLAGEKIKSLKRISGINNISLKAGEKVLIYQMCASQPSAWFNNETYGDNLSFQSVALFRDVTYEAYRKEVGREFGRTVPGIFTDEPNICRFRPGEPARWISWTSIFGDYFKRKRGYDILEKIPYLFFAGQESLIVRHDYWHTIAELYEEAFSKQLGDWCKKNRIAFTGHYLAENELSGQVRTSGAIMPHYIHQQQPGIDILTESISEILTVKQCASVAHQFGRKFVLSELYGCTGWDFSFEGQKWVGDWQFVLGVTTRCQHLTLYSLKGCRKRDYPPSFNYNTTWWKKNKIVEDYFARQSLLLTRGTPVQDILVIHPIASAWCVMSDNKGNAEAQSMSLKFQAFLEMLLGLHRDFDLGDETILARYGSVAGNKLIVSQGKYKVAIIPSMLTINSKTIQLLKKFMDANGWVIAVEPAPELMDAKPNQELVKFFGNARCIPVSERMKVKEVLDRILPRRISVKTNTGEEEKAVICQERNLGQAGIYVMANTDRNSPHDVQVTVARSGLVQEFDLLSGRIKPVISENINGQTRFTAQFGPAGSKAYVVDGSRLPVKNIPPVAGRLLETVFLGPVWQFKRTEPNALTLDSCEYRIRQERWSNAMPVWKAQKELRERLGMVSVHTNGMAQRWTWADKPHANDGMPAHFRLHFAAREIPKGPVYLVLEGAEDYEIKINGKKISNRARGWWLDRAFDRVPIRGIIKGGNAIVLSCAYRNKMEVEDCYLIGDFGVDAVTRELTGEPSVLRTGDWSLQGYPHYAGAMVYRGYFQVKQKSDRVVLTVGNNHSITLAARVNGKLAGDIPWRAADGLDITDRARKGKNKLELIVHGSPRNLLGPLHAAAGKLRWTGAGDFRTEGNSYSREPVFCPWGIMAQVRIDVFGK